jgi:hypothetical protein
MKWWNSAFYAGGWYEMMKLSILCTRFETNYSSCTVRSSENICNSSGGAQAKGKTGWNSVYHQNWWLSEFHPPLNANNVLFLKVFFKFHPPCVWPNLGFWCCDFLISWITLLFLTLFFCLISSKFWKLL